MKKILFIVAFIAISTTAIKAQYFGLKAGLNFSKMDINNASNQYITGMNFGGYVNIPISDRLSFQPELIYSAKGSKSEFDAVFFDIETKLRLDYLEFPLLAVINIGDFIQLQAGPYLGYLINSNYEIEGGLGGETELDNESFSSIDYGLSGGVAINISALQVGARYNYGIPEVQDSEEARIAIGDANNGSFQVYAAFRIGDYDR